MDFAKEIFMSVNHLAAGQMSMDRISDGVYESCTKAPSAR